jgi:peptidyl-prolyl cis-trans isomerase SurA
MKFLHKKTILILFIFFISKSNIVYASIKNSIIAKVGNEIITSFELENKIKTILFFSNQELNQNNVNQVKAQALQSLINSKLMIEELKKYNFNIQNVKTDQYLDDITSKMNLSNAELANLFEIKKIDFATYNEEIKINLTWQQFIYQLYSPKVSIDENQITSELNKVISERKTLEQYNLAEIEVDILDEKKENILIREIKLNIENEGFENTAKKYSISNTALSGGNLGWVNSASLSDAILNELNKLSIGEVTEPMKTLDKILFLKLIEKKEISNLENIDLVKLKKSLVTSASNQIFDMHSKSHLSKKKNLTVIKIINE